MASSEPITAHDLITEVRLGDGYIVRAVDYTPTTHEGHGHIDVERMDPYTQTREPMLTFGYGPTRRWDIAEQLARVGVEMFCQGYGRGQQS